MGIFGQKSKIKAAPQTIRVERVVVSQPRKISSNGNSSSSSNSRPRPTSHPASAAANGNLRVNSNKFGSSSSSLSPNPPFTNGARRTAKSASPYPSSADERRGAAKRKAVSSTPRDSPAFGDSSDDDDEDGDPFSNRNKRIRRSASVDVNRRLRHKKAFGDEERDPHIIHAADIASVATSCPPILGAGADEVSVELQYPSRCKPER